MGCPFELPVKRVKGSVQESLSKEFYNIEDSILIIAQKMTKEQADYIVQAINSHEILVDSNNWMEKATEFYGDGGCPICFSTDEEGCKKGCYLGQLQLKIENYKIALQKIIRGSGNIDRDIWPAQQQRCQAIAQQALEAEKE